MRSKLLPAAVAVAATLPFALSACGGSSAAPTAGAATTQAAAPTTPPNPDAGLLTGTQLVGALAPASYFPSGYLVDKPNSVDTGGDFQSPAASPTPSAECTRLDGTAWIGMTGLSGVSFAQNDYVDKAAKTEQAQEIDEFQAGGADAAMTAIGKLATQCPSFKDTQYGGTVKVAEKPRSGIGDQAYVITLTDSSWANGQTLEAVQVGDAVVTVFSTAGTDNGAATTSKLAQTVVSALQKLGTGATGGATTSGSASASAKSSASSSSAG